MKTKIPLFRILTITTALAMQVQAQNVTNYFNTANADLWRIAGGGVTNATPFEINSISSISIKSGGDSQPYVTGVTNFTGFWQADYVFYLPHGATNISLSYSNLFVDDRGLLLLNGNPIVATGTTAPDIGSLVLTDGGPLQTYSFVGLNGYVSGSVTDGFNTGGYNTLRVIINNTGTGVVGFNTIGGATYLTLSGSVSYTPGPTVSLIKAVKPSLSYLSIGTNYQLQISADLNTWTNHGPVFTATNTSTVYQQYWDVDNWDKLFFRLQIVP